MKSKLTAVIAAILAVIPLAGCSSLDVVGKQSIASFGAVLNTIPELVSEDEMNGGYSLSAPDGSVRFIWSRDYSESPLHDVMLEFDAKPFIDAGLDTSKLPDNYSVYESADMGNAGNTKGKIIMVGTKLGNDKLKYSGEITPLTAYEQIVRKYRKNINFHTALDHYGVLLGGGNMFEWAKDLEKNSATGEKQDKDIVFVLNPDPLISAGVDPNKTDGWAYAQVPTDDGLVWKLLKAFDLK